MSEIARSQARFLGKTLGRQVVRIAARRRIVNLDQTLFDAALEVGVNEAKRDAKLGGDTALGALAVILNGA